MYSTRIPRVLNAFLYVVKKNSGNRVLTVVKWFSFDNLEKKICIFKRIFTFYTKLEAKNCFVTNILFLLRFQSSKCHGLFDVGKFGN